MKNAADLAADIRDLIEAELPSLDADGKRILARRIWQCLEPYAALPVPKAESLKPMTEPQARVFEVETMTFGKYIGRAIGDVPLDYLEWLSDASREFWQKCHRYLNSERVKREREGDAE
jgi:hypothetical protein